MTVAAFSAPTMCVRKQPQLPVCHGLHVCENFSPVMRPEKALPLGMRAALPQQSRGPLLSDLQLPEVM